MHTVKKLAHGARAEESPMSMNISQSLLPEFDVEIANTRKTLERVPEGNPDFRPHPKSMTLARLAGHVAEIPMWVLMTLGQDEVDMNPVGGFAYRPDVD